MKTIICVEKDLSLIHEVYYPNLNDKSINIHAFDNYDTAIKFLDKTSQVHLVISSYSTSYWVKAYQKGETSLPPEQLCFYFFTLVQQIHPQVPCLLFSAQCEKSMIKSQTAARHIHCISKFDSSAFSKILELLK